MMQEKSKRVLLIDDHALYGEGLAVALRRSTLRLRLDSVATLEAAFDAIEMRRGATRRCPRPPYDGIIYDWHLRDSACGVHGLISLLQYAPGVPVLTISGDREDAVGMTALRLGAAGHVRKDADTITICAAVGKLVEREPTRAAQPGADGHAVRERVAALSERQREVFGLLLEGRSNKLIADGLGIVEATVKRHVSAVYRVLGVRTRTQAMRLARQAGLV